MRRKMGLGVAWLGATAVSVVIASTAVAGVRDRVVETPHAIGVPTTSTTLAPASTSSSAGPITTSVTASTTTGPPETTVTTSADAGTTTTDGPESTTSTTTTTTTTTTTAAPVLMRESFSLIGGTVVLEYGGEEVWVVSTVPNAGFYPEVYNKGPYEVKVEFESEDHESKLTAHMDNGQLKVETDEEGEHDDDDDDDHD